MQRTMKPIPKWASILGWVFGGFFALGGMTEISGGAPVSSIAFFTISGLLIPPVREKVYGLTGIDISMWIRGFSIFVLLLIGASTSKIDSGQTSSTAKPMIEENVVDSISEETSAQKTGEEQQPDKISQSEEEKKLREIIGDSFVNIISIDLETVNYDENFNLVEDHQWVIDIVFKGKDNFTHKMIRAGIEMNMTKGYKAIYTSGIPIRAVTIEAHMPLTDRFGNEEMGRVYGTRLRNEVGYKVRWESRNFISINFTRLWETYWLQPFLKAVPSFWD